MKLIKPKEIHPFIPEKYKKSASFYPYVLPIFGKMYFGRIKRIIRFFLSLNKNFPRVLEVGGGMGLFSTNFKLNFPKNTLILLDICPNQIFLIMRKILSEKFKINLENNFEYNFECDIQDKTGYERSSFDLVFALDVLEHVPNPDAALNEILRIIKDNGLLFISVPTESKILQLIRSFYGRMKPIVTNPHWNGMIKSENEFFKCLKKKPINIIWKEKYPYNFLPKLFSYDIFYLIQKKKEDSNE